MHRLAVAIGLLLASSASGAVIPVDWNDDGASGTLGGVTVTMTGLESPGLFHTDDLEDPFELTGDDFAGGPIPGVTELSSYDVLSDWTATFSEPITNLLLYVVFWRGPSGQPEPPDDVMIYTFDQTFTVLSGLGDAVFPEGDKTFAAPEDVFHLGVLRFDGPVTSLSLTSNSFGHSAQLLTFGVVPEPSAPLLAALALGLAVRARRR